MNRYDLAIAYRIYPKVSKPAAGLPLAGDKLQLSEVCLRSLKHSLAGLRVKLWALLDGCPEAYADLFRKYFDERDLVLVPLDSMGNRATFEKQIDILLEQEASDLVYFAEDDYIYLPAQFPRLIEFLQACEDVHFVTPYDHPDCYNLRIHRHPKWMRVHGGHHWRTAASTCLTVLMRKQTLQKSEAIFRSYGRRNLDCSLWLSLTKKCVFAPVQFLRFAFLEPPFAKIMAKTWIYGWRQILFEAPMQLWIPVPGFATHLDAQAMSPTIDWAAVIRKQAEAVVLESGQNKSYMESKSTSAVMD